MKYVAKLFTTENDVLINLGFNPDVSILKSLEFNKEAGEIELLVRTAERTDCTVKAENGSEVRRRRMEIKHLPNAKNGGVVISNSERKVILDSNGVSAEKIISKSWEITKGIIQQESKEFTFEEFGKHALHRLQQQFLNTPDTKDTVLTRMNIIQMIKDLKELGLK